MKKLIFLLIGVLAFNFIGATPDFSVKNELSIEYSLDVAPVIDADSVNYIDSVLYNVPISRRLYSLYDVSETDITYTTDFVLSRQSNNLHSYFKAKYSNISELGIKGISNVSFSNIQHYNYKNTSLCNDYRTKKSFTSNIGYNIKIYRATHPNWYIS